MGEGKDDRESVLQRFCRFGRWIYVQRLRLELWSWGVPPNSEGDGLRQRYIREGPLTKQALPSDEAVYPTQPLEVPMDNVILEMELTQDQRAQFQALMQALNHDEPEETFRKLLEFGVNAISLTTKENPVVWMYTRDPKKSTGSESVSCPECQTSFVPNTVRQADDGYREIQVRLAD